MAKTLHGGSCSNPNLAMVVFKPKKGLRKHRIFSDVEFMVVANHFYFTILYRGSGFKNETVMVSGNPDFATLESGTFCLEFIGSSLFNPIVFPTPKQELIGEFSQKWRKFEGRFKSQNDG